MLRIKDRTTDTGRSQRLWPVFVMLIAIAALPTAGVLWFMSQAMQNERLVVEQRLKDVYRSRLKTAADRIRTLWRDKSVRLLESDRQGNESEAFADLIKSDQADSVLFYRNGVLVYPRLAAGSNARPEPDTRSWREARSLEFGANSQKAAANAYAEIARKASSDRESAMALTAQARCLNKAGREAEAIDLLNKKLGASRYFKVTDGSGRSVQANAMLFALQLMKDPSRPAFRKTAVELAERLNDYRDAQIPSAQRRFLMRQLQSLWPECPQFPTLGAEELAAEFARLPVDRFISGQVQPAGIKNVWAYRVPDGSMAALFRQNNLVSFMQSSIADQEVVQGITISVQSSEAADSSSLQEALGEAFPSWRLVLTLEGPDPFKTESKQKFYVWIGVLTTTGIAMVSLILAGYLRRQVRLTGLKNDLIATVSHELKTPLSSMRLLVDTLRDGRCHDTRLVQEYLQMISKENARLSSLIEGFLTFSRMERKKAKFEQEVVQTNKIVHEALEAVGNRIQAPNCRLEVDLATDSPPVIGDREALITVVVNLLDNALKYTGDEKEIRLRTFSSDGYVRIEVRDNGIGFTHSAARKIFDRFYQVDRTLSRQAGGCGLGLSIVKFIIAAHKGSVTAKSQVGKGSTFTVQLPAV